MNGNLGRNTQKRAHGASGGSTMVDMKAQKGEHKGYFGGVGHAPVAYSVRCITLLPRPDADKYGDEANNIWAHFREVYDEINRTGIEKGDYIKVIYKDEYHIHIEKLPGDT